MAGYVTLMRSASYLRESVGESAQLSKSAEPSRAEQRLDEVDRASDERRVEVDLRGEEPRSILGPEEIWPAAACKGRGFGVGPSARK
jgi:hypothetical protein